MKLTATILLRINSGTGLSDPCIVCGVTFSKCPHDITETADLIKRASKLSAEQRSDILRKNQ